jgi:hypothetical protein
LYAAWHLACSLPLVRRTELEEPVLRKRSHVIVALALASSVLGFPGLYAQAPSPPAECPSLLPSDSLKTASALLDRIGRVVSDARKEVDPDDLAPVSTTGRAGASATVEMRAEDLDEIRAEIAQIKLLLQSTTKAP